MSLPHEADSRMNTFVLFMLVAQTAPLASQSAASASKMQAQSLLTEGSRLYGQGNYAGALEKFNAAYRAYPSPKLLFNIGQANRDLSRPAEAREAFERYVASEDDVSSPTVTEARASLEELQRSLGRIRVDCETSGAEVRLDGKSAGVAPLARVLWATAGRHQVTASHARSALALEDVDVKAGVLTVVTLRLQPLATPVTDVSKPESAAVEKERHWRWAWVATGTTVALGVGAIVAGLAMQSKYDSLNSSCGSASVAGTGCQNGDIDAVTTRKNVANVLWAVTGAAAVTAGILFYVEGRPVSVLPVAGPLTGAVARTTF